jgi:hypothetical protein
MSERIESQTNRGFLSGTEENCRFVGIDSERINVRQREKIEEGEK